MKTLLALLLLIVCGGTLQAQDDPSTMVGGNHYSGYSIDDLDTVSMINGNLMLHIPIYSLKQVGKMPLTFSISGNNLQFQETQSCAPADNDPCGATNRVYGAVIGCTGGIALQADQDLSICRTTHAEDLYVSDPNTTTGQSLSGRFMYPTFDVVRGGVNSTRLYQDYNSQTKLRSTNGSGYLLSADASFFSDQTDVDYPTGTTTDFDLYDKEGTRSHFTTLSDLYGTFETQRVDSNGNTIQRIAVGSGSNEHFYYVDTLGRQFSDAPREVGGNGMSTDVSACPASAASFQAAARSYSWSVPGYSQPLIFCYADVWVRTDYYGTPGGVTFNGWSMYEDTNGSMPVLQSVKLPDGTYWKFEYDAADPNNSNSVAYGNITKVITPQGGSISYTYGEYCTLMPPSKCYSGLATRTVDDGVGNSRTWEYHVQDTVVPYTATAPTQTTTRVVMPLDPGQSVRNETVYIYVDPTGSPVLEPTVEKERQVYQGSASGGQLLEDITNTYSASTDPSPVYHLGYASVLPNQVSTSLQAVSSSVSYPVYDSGFTAMQTECFRTYTEYPSQYLCSQYIPYGGTGTRQLSLGLQEEVDHTNYPGYPNKQELTSYVWELSPSNAYRDANLLTAPSLINVTDGANTVTTNYVYDEVNGSPQGAHGNATTTTKSGSLGGSVSTSAVYDSSGRMTKTFDGRGNETDFEFTDASSGQVTKATRPATNGISHVDSYTYDAATGKMLTHTDENQNQTHFTYSDPLGRLTKIQVPVSASVNSNKTIDYSVPRVVTVKQDENQSADGALVTSTTYDGLGRAISTETPDSATVDVSYVASGAIASKSNPHFAGVSSSSDFVSTFTYDALGRKSAQVEPDATRSWKYSGNTIDYYIGSTHFWKQSLDAFGSLVEVYEDPDILNLHTSYTYSFLGNLTDVSQQGLTRHFDYDSLSRLTQSHNPETGWICYGTTNGQAANGSNCSASYDGNGNLQYKTDSRGITAQYLYDNLNRLLSKTYTSDAQNTPSSCYEYDSSTNAGTGTNQGGHLTQEWTQLGPCPAVVPSSGILARRSLLSYDGLGNVLSEERCTASHCAPSGVPVPLTYAYDLVSHLTSYTDGPGSHTLYNCYTAGTAGELTQVQTSTCRTLSSDYLYRAESYLPSGGPAKEDYGTYLQGTRAVDKLLRSTVLSVKAQ